MQIRTRFSITADGYVATPDGGMRLTPSLSTDTRLTLEEQHSLPEGAVELVYACS